MKAPSDGHGVLGWPPVRSIVSARGQPSRNRGRKLLWSQSDRCAFPGCEHALVIRGPTGEITKPVVIECHIVTQRDSAEIVRAPKILTDDERVRHAVLIADRHSERNRVLMCVTHSTLIHDPAQGRVRAFDGGSAG